MHHLFLPPFLKGLGTGAGLIIAIGAQNAFVLKQGIVKNHVFVTALLCIVLDVALISLGVGGFGTILASNSLLLTLSKWGGALFLGYYGFRSFRAVFASEAIDVTGERRRPGLKATILTVLALTLLNPHAYLDTIVLLGSIGAQFPAEERVFFGAGAIIASIIWFFTLSYGARYLAPLFQKPVSWKVLDFLVGVIMWSIALLLILND